MKPQVMKQPVKSAVGGQRRVSAVAPAEPVLSPKAMALIGTAVVALLILVFVIWRTAAAHSTTMDQATINAHIAAKAAKDHSHYH